MNHERTLRTQEPVPEGADVVSVSELTAQVKAVLEGDFPTVWVSGEVSNLARPRSGHMYLSLKDAESQVKAVIYRGVALRLRFDLQDGMDVVVRGRLTVYNPRGEYQLIIEELHPRGIGALELALRQLREKLFTLGYFDPARKKPLPRIPNRIALVTSPTGAAVRDMLNILGRRWPLAEVWVCPVAVQGHGAAADVAAMIRRVNTFRPRPDLLIVGRGGGSIEDLWAFNEEVVAHAIHDSAIPVISAVGHEVDVTISDLVADRRAATPSEAAELAVPGREEVLEDLFRVDARLKELLLSRLQNAWRRWQHLAERPAFRVPAERLRQFERRLDDWEARLHRAARQRVQAAENRAGSLAARLETLSPLNVLRRGYSLTRKADGQVIRDPNQTGPGERIITLTEKGSITSRVESVAPVRKPR